MAGDQPNKEEKILYQTDVDAGRRNWKGREISAGSELSRGAFSSAG